MPSENMIPMQRPQENGCQCHFLHPQKVWIIHGHPDKVHNYGYGSVQIWIAMVMGINQIKPSMLVPSVTTEVTPNHSWFSLNTSHGDPKNIGGRYMNLANQGCPMSTQEWYDHHT